MARVDVKVVLLGSSGVGKTCLLDRYVNDQFENQPRNTIGAAFAAKKVALKGGKSITLGVWDTAGAEQFQSLSRMYYCGAKTAVCCFDASKQRSFQKMQFWVSELKEHEPQCRVWVCQTRSDLVEEARNGGLKREVTEETAQQFSDSIDAPLVVTSAKQGTGIQELFQDMAESVADKVHEVPSPSQLAAISTGPRSYSIMLSPDQSPTDTTLEAGLDLSRGVDLSQIVDFNHSVGQSAPKARTKPSSCC